MMAKSTPVAHRATIQLPLGITPGESARYTKDLLISLHGIALQQSQPKLAELLEAAAAEANRLTVIEPSG